MYIQGTLVRHRAILAPAPRERFAVSVEGGKDGLHFIVGSRLSFLTEAQAGLSDVPLRFREHGSWPHSEAISAALCLPWVSITMSI